MGQKVDEGGVDDRKNCGVWQAVTRNQLEVGPVSPVSAQLVSLFVFTLERSLRWNQDAQREEDQSRLNEIIMYLTKMRTG